MIRNYSTYNGSIRAYDIKTKEMFYNISIDTPDTSPRCITSEDIDCLSMKKISDCIIMESIGAQDKTGKEIFELDVVSVKNYKNPNVKRIGVVIYNTKTCSYFMEGISDGFFDIWDEYKIIGTIFDDEHKDLYNKVKEKLGL